MVDRGARALVCGGVGIAAIAGCSDTKVASRPDVAGVITTTTSPPTVPIAPPPTGKVPTMTAKPSADPTTRVVARLKVIDNGTLKMGTEFNRRFIGLQLQSAGFTAADGECVTTKIAASAGPAFSTWTFTQLVAGAQSGASRDVLLSCVPTDRLAALASRTAAPSVSSLAPGLMRSVLSELATSWFEAGGLTATEATCLADKLIGGVDDQRLAVIFSARSFDDTAIGTALPSCLDAARLASLAS